jgi:hypothetical protein
VVTGTVISSSAFNALTADLATGLSTAITKDGQTATTVRIPFAQGINSSLTTDTSSGSTGSIFTAGGVGITKGLFVGGTATFSATPVFSALTASSAVATDASKNLVSVTNTGTGNNVLATSPTLVTPALGTPSSGVMTNVTGINYDGFKNRIINGAMGIWQRGTSFTSGGPTTYTADRFYGNGSSGTISRSTDAPAGFTYSFSNAASSTDFPGITQRIESVNITDCASQTVIVSFWVKQTSGTSGLSISLRYPNAADDWSSSTSIVESNIVGTMPSSWTKYTFSYTLPSNVTNGISVTLFVPASSVTSTFLITGVQLEKGSTATSFDYRSIGTELALCQRYFCKTFDIGTAPGNNVATVGSFMLGALTVVNYEPSITWRYPVEMRAAPTITLYNPETGTSGQWSAGGGTVSANARSLFTGTSATVIDNSDTTIAGGSSWRIQAASSAEL